MDETRVAAFGKYVYLSCSYRLVFMVPTGLIVLVWWVGLIVFAWWVRLAFLGTATAIQYTEQLREHSWL